MMVSCHKVTELVEKEQYFELTFKEKVQMRLHTAMCNICKQYMKQSQLLDKMLQLELEKNPKIDPSNGPEIEALKEKIKKSLS